jgi:hypothetical protein
MAFPLGNPAGTGRFITCPLMALLTNAGRSDATYATVMIRGINHFDLILQARSLTVS